MKKVVSLQDISCYGQCSLTVALPILSSYGIETAILPSGILSTHTGGFQNYTFLDLTDELPKIIRHWSEAQIRFDAIYTGYIGDVRQFAMVDDLRALLNPEGLLIVDPAMADNGKLYAALSEDIVAGMRSISAQADLILPNLTEACFLLDRPYQETWTREETLELVRQLGDLGAKKVILTGVKPEPGKIGALAYDKATGAITEYYTELMEQSYHGTGDIFSSVAIAAILNGKSTQDALKEACDFVVRSIRKTMGDPTHNYGVKFEQVLAEK